LLMAEREKALKERDAAQTRIGTILNEKNTIIKQKKVALKEGQQLRQQLVLSAENVERLKQKITEVSTDVQKVREQDADRFSKLKQQFEQELKQKQITISQLKNRMTVVNVTAEILFGSGSATIKPKGQKVLELIAETLNKHPGQMISIEGHTDALPVARDSQYPTNRELSSARPASAARHLENRAG
ncbi:MAG: OmpA family protein, partial [Gammaproteobacteria bacterium]|nr:OmpA family protein [Gammaproteobacteria bacterium]